MHNNGAASANTVRALNLSLWLCVLTQKIALPGNIEFTLVILWGTMLYLFARRAATISLQRLLIYALVFASVFLLQMLFNGKISFAAIMFVIPLYALFVFVVPLSNTDYIRILRNFQQIGLFTAFLALGQWVTQAVGIGMLDIEKIIPKGLLYVRYNYLQPVDWRSSWIQPNSIFFLEASFVCQLIAIALVVEVFIFQRIARIAILFVALFSTLAGTGALIVLLMAPFGIKLANRQNLILAAFLIPFGLAFLVLSGLGDYFIGRAGEFGLEQTSGYGRFIEPYVMLARIYDSDPIGSIFAGIGPGNIQDLDYVSRTLTANPVSKLIAEYGWISGIIWFYFIHVTMYRSNVPFYILFPLFYKFNLMNGSLLMPIEVAYCVLLAAVLRLPRRLDYQSLVALAKSVDQPRPQPLQPFRPPGLNPALRRK